jgi:hydrogenase expression/formation protein HypC
MCLGIPGEVAELVPDNDQLAQVDVRGTRRLVNIGMLADEVLAPGDWVLIHVGFAMDKITKEQAAEALAGLELLGREASAADR